MFLFAALPCHENGLAFNGQGRMGMFWRLLDYMLAAAPLGMFKEAAFLSITVVRRLCYYGAMQPNMAIPEAGLVLIDAEAIGAQLDAAMQLSELRCALTNAVSRVLHECCHVLDFHVMGDAMTELDEPLQKLFPHHTYPTALQPQWS